MDASSRPPDGGISELDGADADPRDVQDAGSPPNAAATAAQILAVRTAIRDATMRPASLPSLQVSNALVTFIKQGYGGAAPGTADGPGFFVQNTNDGPAIFVAVDPSSIVKGGVRVGDRLNLVATEGTLSADVALVSGATADLVGEGAPLPTPQPVSDVKLYPIFEVDWLLESELVSATATIAADFESSGQGFVQARLTTAGHPVAADGFFLRVPSSWVAEKGAAVGCTVTFRQTPLFRRHNWVMLSAWSLSDAEVTCPPLNVLSTYPTNLSNQIPTATGFSVTFNQRFNPNSIVLQTAPGVCTGTAQLSADGFATCLAFATSSPGQDPTQQIAALMPKSTLSATAEYNFKMTTDVRAATGVKLAEDRVVIFQTAAGQPTCSDSVVISQVYGGGGSVTSSYDKDFVELHNRGSTPVSVAGWTIQYASAMGSSWTAFTLPSVSIPAGGYFLFASGVGPSDADATGSLTLGTSAGKVALVSSTAVLTNPLPVGTPWLDLVAYGETSLAEGSPTSTLSTTTAASRGAAGCIDNDSNLRDFLVALPSPRSSQHPTLVCECGQ